MYFLGFRNAMHYCFNEYLFVQTAKEIKEGRCSLRLLGRIVGLTSVAVLK